MTAQRILRFCVHMHEKEKDNAQELRAETETWNKTTTVLGPTTVLY